LGLSFLALYTVRNVYYLPVEDNDGHNLCSVYIWFLLAAQMESVLQV